MKYPFITKYKGIYYPAGTEVPINDEPIKEEIPKKEAEVISTVDNEEPEQEEIVVTDKKYTRTDINRMNTEQLRKLGTELGIKGAEDKSGSQLKKILPDRLGI